MKFVNCAILCGGQSRRMGTNKAELPWDGGNLLNIIAAELSKLGDVFLSVSRKDLTYPGTYPVIVDEYPGCGPLGGICTALSVCKTPLLFVVSCDMPFVTARVGASLAGCITEDVQAVIPREISGRVHPLCAVYHRAALPSLAAQLQLGNYRMRDALHQIRTLYLPAHTLPGGERSLVNMNTPAEYNAALFCKDGGNEV